MCRRKTRRMRGIKRQCCDGVVALVSMVELLQGKGRFVMKRMRFGAWASLLLMSAVAGCSESGAQATVGTMVRDDAKMMEGEMMMKDGPMMNDGAMKKDGRMMKEDGK